MKDWQTRGFTLIELIVVVSIVALLLSLTLPAYQRQLRNTRRSLGASELLQVMMRQEQYFLDHKRYAQSLMELDFPSSPYAIDPQGNIVSSQNDSRIYLINIATHSNAYTLWAIPQLSQAADRMCGTLSLDSMGTRLAAGEAGARECW